VEFNSKVRLFVSDVLRDWVTGDYRFTSQTAVERTGLRQLVAVMEGLDLDDPRLFGDGPELDVGLHFEVTDENGNLVYQLTVEALGGINHNGDMLDFFHEFQTIGGGFGAGGAVPKRRIFVWHLHDGERGVELLPGWRLRVLAHDDFASRVSEFHIHVFGNEVYERVFNPEA
jgi:hypothetical protein